jgi:hypothetical protein
MTTNTQKKIPITADIAAVNKSKLFLSRVRVQRSNNTHEMINDHHLRVLMVLVKHPRG